MARSWYTRSNAKPKFIQTPRVKAVARERAWMAAHPYAFGGHDYVAAHLRKRARDRMHTIAREQQYMRTANFGNYKLNKYRRSMARHDGSIKRVTFRSGKKRYHFRQM
jgi:hypothetical protein